VHVDTTLSASANWPERGGAPGHFFALDAETGQLYLRSDPNAESWRGCALGGMRGGDGGNCGREEAVVLPLARQDAKALFYGGYGDGVAGDRAVDGNSFTGESV
jgi:hypothetical protein